LVKLCHVVFLRRRLPAPGEVVRSQHIIDQSLRPVPWP